MTRDENMIGKRYRIKATVRKTRWEDEAVDRKKTVKKLIGVTLLVLAGVFGGVLSVMPTWAAFGTVFAYISVQTGIWVL